MNEIGSKKPLQSLQFRHDVGPKVRRISCGVRKCSASTPFANDHLGQRPSNNAFACYSMIAECACVINLPQG